MRLFLTLALLVFASPAWAQMTCATKNTNNQATFDSCVSPAYNLSLGMIDGAASTSDALSRYQWNMRQVLEGESYDSLFDDAPNDVIVAVIGMYPGHQNHPDLVNRYLTGINLIEGGTNTNPPGGWDGKEATSSNSHDQCVAGVIAAEHNSIGIAGVFHRAKILPIRADFWTTDNAIDAAVAAGADVIHLAGIDPGQDSDVWDELFYIHPNFYTESWTGNQPLRPMFQTPSIASSVGGEFTKIREAINDASFGGVLVEATIANWNGKLTIMMMPSLGEVLSAFATNVKGEVSPANATAHFADILAPGGDRRTLSVTPSLPSNVHVGNAAGDEDDILCPVGSGSYAYGTLGSFAGPHLAGALAIIKSYLPNATTQDARRLITRSAQPLAITNLHLDGAIGGMLSLKGLKAAIDAE